jgi:hypothetical protein
MAILKAKSKRKEHKLVGASMPSWFYVYLSLYSMAKGTSKTDVIKLKLHEWYTEKREKDSEEALVKQVIERIHRLWLTEKSLKKKGMTYEIFKENIEFELDSKGIPQNFINLIMERI